MGPLRKIANALKDIYVDELTTAEHVIFDVLEKEGILEEVEDESGDVVVQLTRLGKEDWSR